MRSAPNISQSPRGWFALAADPVFAAGPPKKVTVKVAVLIRRLFAARGRRRRSRRSAQRRTGFRVHEKELAVATNIKPLLKLDPRVMAGTPSGVTVIPNSTPLTIETRSKKRARSSTGRWPSARKGWNWQAAGSPRHKG